ncbi:putative polysaccharide biosynthesis protein [Desulfolucanica intricata]|uniref:putative polysaccharide biosynthesis protein n=1 Tax=Desulfolucanica intricata TaxID=1285191 RepID=UPI0008377CE4|nr:polysaccharide biosynthesis protein [Desulfolucanica intricata]
MIKTNIKKQSFIKGALILTAAGILIRILGAVYRIPLGRMLGDEGLGIYAVPNQFYLLLFTISSAGIPVAVARLVSEKIASGQYRDAYTTFRLARATMLTIGLVFSFLLFFGAQWLVDTGIVANPNSFYGLRAVAPIVFFAALTASYRGLFQGIQNMTAVAVSQVADQVMLVIGTITFSYLLLPQGLAIAAAGANLGALPGAMAASMIMLYYYWRERREFKEWRQHKSNLGNESNWQIFKNIFSTALPISFASVAMAITGIIDNKLIIDRLQLVGYTQQQATAFYGQFNQMAYSFINIAIAFALSLGTSLVPSVAEAYAAKDYEKIKQQTAQGLRLAIIFALPASAGLFVLASNLTLFIFDNKQAGVPLAYVAFSIVFWSIHLVTSGVLQGMGKVIIPVRNLLAGIVFRIAFTYFLTPGPLGIRAAALATVGMFTISSILNILTITKLVGFKFRLYKTIIRAGIATVIMALGVLEIYNLLYIFTGSNNLATCAGIFFGAMIYGLAVIAGGILTPDELKRIPKIGTAAAKMAKIIKKT